MQFDQLRRREFITLLGGVAATPLLPPLVARAQPGLPVIGYLDAASADGRAPFVAALREGLKATGFVEGTTFVLEHRFADNQPDRLPALAADLVRRPVTAIVAGGNAAARAAKAAPATIPVIFVVGDDPVKTGLVSSLNQPGGNVTGVTPLAAELGPKRLELLHELLPSARILALLVNPTNANAELLTREAHEAASTLGLQIHVLHASTDREFDAIFASLEKLRAGGLVIGANVFFNSKLEQLGALSVRHAVPTIYQNREFAVAGGLLSYGGNMQAFHTAGTLTGRILKGEKPADLPSQQSTKVELIINTKALGVTVPLSLLGRADAVIE